MRQTSSSFQQKSKKSFSTRLFHLPVRLRWLAGCVLVLLAYTAWNIQRPVPVAAAGTISLTAIDVAYTQNFNSLSSDIFSNTVPAGWDFLETGSGADGTYRSDNGSFSNGDTRSYGSNGASDRAFGTLRVDGSVSSVIGASFTNNIGYGITGLNIAYTGEQWRLGTTGRVDRLNFEYSLDASSLSTGTWTPVTALNFTAPLTTGLIGAKDGNAAGNRTAITSAISGLSIANGATFWIRWTDFDATGAEDGLAVDDFSLTPSTCTQTVTNGNDSGPGSLRDAIANVCTGGLITFQAGVTTVNLTSAELFINKNLTIDGGVSGVTVTRMAGSPNFRIFFVNSGTDVLRNLTISNGNVSSDVGGGILNNGTTTLTNCTVSNNTVSSGFSTGGGLANYGTTMLTNCTVSNNTVSNGSGGGLVNYGTTTLTNCTISNNTVSNGGGGLTNFGTTTLTNCTISNNTVSGGGGGLANSSTTTLTNCTISNNTALGPGGGLVVFSGNTILVNTIVAQNTGGASSNISGTVNTSSSFNNLIGTSGTGGLTNGVNGNRVGVATPLLGVLASNGGPTQTIDLLPGSPAIDAGTATGAPATDQRGFSRPVGVGFDIGAVESCSATALVTNGNDSGPGSLRQILADVCQGSTITFQPNVATVTLTSGELVVNRSLTINGDPGVTITRGSGAFRIFNITAGTVAFNNLTITNGSAANGAGVLNAGTLTMSNCQVANNQEGAIHNSGILTISNSTLNGNMVGLNSFDGSSITHVGSALTLTNVTVNGNVCGQNGGGLLLAGNALLTNCTIAGNSQPVGSGAGIQVSSGVVRLINTIVAGNTGGSPSDISGSIDTANSFNNLIGIGGSGGLTNGVNGNQVGVAAPGLGTLGLNGGATPTVPLLAGSPAIDAGTAVGAPATDQRGFGRNATTDIGAFEFNGSDPGTTVISINRNGAATVCGGTSVSWTVIFATPVTGVTSGNFALANSGLTGPAITGVTGSGNRLTVTASVGTGSGTLGLNMVNSTGVVSVVTNLPFTGQVFSVGSSLTVTAGSNSPLVAGATLNLTATPAGAGTFTFAWTGPGGFTSSQQNPSLSNVTAANTGTYTVTMTETGSGCTGMASTQVALELSGSVGLGVGSTNYTGGTPPVNPANPAYGTFLINTTLTNTSGGTLQAPLFFRVTILEKVPVVPSDPMPYWLDSRDAGSPPDVGAVQTVAAPLANNASTPVTFRVAVAQSNRATFRLFVDFFGATNTSPVVRKIGGFELTPQFPVQNLSSEDSQPSILSPQSWDDTQSSVLSPQSSLIGGAGLQSGSTVAVDPKEPRRMAVAANNYELGTVAVRYTEDGGASWREYRASRTLGSSTYAKAFDPALGYDRNGSLFVTYALANVTDNSSAVAIASKGLDRLTFSPAVALASYSHAEQTLPSRTTLAIEGSKIVAVWESLSGGSQTSRIHAMTLAPRRSVVVAEGGVTQPTVTVTPEGRIVVGWNDWANRQLKTATSLDNSTYSDPVTVAEPGLGYGYRIPALADVLALSGFSIKADPTGNGRLFACFTNLGSGLDVFLSRSSDNGKSWDSPALVNDDKSDANQFNPALAVDASGNVAISFCDTRLDGTGSTTHVFLARSRNSGVSFEPNEQVTTEASNTSASRMTRIRGANLGERMGIAPAAKSGWILVWTDTRLGSEDIFLTTK